MTFSAETGARGAHGVADGVAAMFLETAGRHPERPAIVHNGRVLTYSRLRRLVVEAARRVGRDPGVVAVDARRSPGTIAALFGVWAAGGVYCPIDPAFPAGRRQAMLAAAGCRIRLSTGEDRPDAVYADPAPAVAHAPAARVPGEPPPAYVLFTSGSTGSPKPVVVSARAIEVTVRSLRELFAIAPTDRVLQFASLNWDTSFEEILPTLTTGASLVFHDDAHSGSFPRFLRMVERERITVMDLPTAFWHELVGYLAEDGRSLPECVRLVIIGGEAVRPARLADWRGLDTASVRLLNTYGCTETTLITHAVDLHGPQADPPAGLGERVPIGRPLPHVVEHHGDGEELLVGGPAIADGYLGMREATATRFVVIGGRRFFRTGDRVGRLPGGLLVHEGRVDDELKVRGVRVNPAEVEAHIAGHPMVAAVAVAGVEVAGRTVLAAYVVPKGGVHGANGSHGGDGSNGDGGADVAAAILAYLRERVPAHLVPGRVSLVADLVYTPSGKIDRRRTKEILT